MIRGFANQLAADLYADKKTTKAAKRFPAQLRRVARRKLLYLHDAEELRDLKVPPGNRLEAMKGNLRGQYSIRINDQWRVVFRWTAGHAHDVQIVDYHR